VGQKFVPNALLFLSATIIGVLMIELGLRVLYPITFMNVETQGAQETAGWALFTPDRVLGWHPTLGTDLYDENGILFGRSIYAKPVGPKLLLIGDSVTARAQILNGLANLMPPEITFLNGGVEGYNIEQEVEFFFRFQKDLRPDAIIHQMHISNLNARRQLMRPRDGTIRLYSPRVTEVTINPTLYKHSQIYRFLIANLASRFSKDELKASAVESLRRMGDYARDNGIAYHLVLFPVLEPLANWTAYDRETRDYLLNAARTLGLDVIDLDPVAEQMISVGVDPKQGPGDNWHPNAQMGEAAAKYIVERMPSLLSIQPRREHFKSPLGSQRADPMATR